MAKKLKKQEAQQPDEVVRMSSQEIWQAGLSAFAKAQEEEGKFFSMQLFEERVLRALGSIGVPSSKEIDALNERIDALSRQVAALSAGPVVARAAARLVAKPAASKAAGSKSSKKPVTAKASPKAAKK